MMEMRRTECNSELVRCEYKFTSSAITSDNEYKFRVEKGQWKWVSSGWRTGEPMGAPSRVSVIFADQNPYRFWPSFVPLMDIPKGFTSKMTLEVA